LVVWNADSTVEMFNPPDHDRIGLPVEYAASGTSTTAIA